MNFFFVFFRTFPSSLSLVDDEAVMPLDVDGSAAVMVLAISENCLKCRDGPRFHVENKLLDEDELLDDDDEDDNEGIVKVIT